LELPNPFKKRTFDWGCKGKGQNLNLQSYDIIFTSNPFLAQKTAFFIKTPSPQFLPEFVFHQPTRNKCGFYFENVL
jgi:hypothetical protein